MLPQFALTRVFYTPTPRPAYLPARRLEMATKKISTDMPNLAKFWCDDLSSSVAEEILARPEGQRVLVNVASVEYAKVTQLLLMIPLIPLMLFCEL